MRLRTEELVAEKGSHVTLSNTDLRGTFFLCLLISMMVLGSSQMGRSRLDPNPSKGLQFGNIRENENFVSAFAVTIPLLSEVWGRQNRGAGGALAPGT